MHLYEIEVSVLERCASHTRIFIQSTYMHTYILTYILTYIHTYKTNLHSYIHTCIPTYMHTCIHTYMYIYIHTGIFRSICAAIVCEHMGVARGDMCSFRPLSTRLFQIPNPGVFPSNVEIKQIQDLGWQRSVGSMNVYGSFLQESYLCRARLQKSPEN